MFESLSGNKTQSTNDDTIKNEWLRRSGIAMESGQILSGYSPGGSVFVLPDDTGMFVPRGSRLLFRMHYVATGRPERNLTQLGLFAYSHQPRWIHSNDVIINRALNIPPGAKEYRMTASYVFKENVLLTGLQPHMHYRGRSMRFTIDYPDGKSETVLSVPNYKFRWQRQYVFQNPKRIPAGTRMTIEGRHDNSSQNPDNPDPSKTVVHGPESGNEMFAGILSYTVSKE